jgi:hypothetical protein
MAKNEFEKLGSDLDENSEASDLNEASKLGDLDEVLKNGYLKEALLNEAGLIQMEITTLNKQINDLTRKLLLEKTSLEEKFRDIAEKIVIECPLVYCNSSDADGALESGYYYVFGLPKGLETEKISINAWSRETILSIDGVEFEEDFELFKSKEELLLYVLSLKK